MTLGTYMQRHWLWEYDDGETRGRLQRFMLIPIDASPELVAGILEYSCAFGIMDSPIQNISDAKSSYSDHSSSLSSITFVKDNLELFLLFLIIFNYLLI